MKKKQTSKQAMDAYIQTLPAKGTLLTGAEQQRDELLERAKGLLVRVLEMDIDIQLLWREMVNSRPIHTKPVKLTEAVTGLAGMIESYAIANIPGGNVSIDALAAEADERG